MLISRHLGLKLNSLVFDLAFLFYWFLFSFPFFLNFNLQIFLFSPVLFANFGKLFVILLSSSCLTYRAVLLKSHQPALKQSFLTMYLIFMADDFICSDGEGWVPCQVENQVKNLHPTHHLLTLNSPWTSLFCLLLYLVTKECCLSPPDASLNSQASPHHLLS